MNIMLPLKHYDILKISYWTQLQIYPLLLNSLSAATKQYTFIKRRFRWGHRWVNTVVSQSKLFVDGPDGVGERRRSRCVVLTVEVSPYLNLNLYSTVFSS